jgi:hypothetical protein
LYNLCVGVISSVIGTVHISIRFRQDRDSVSS